MTHFLVVVVQWRQRNVQKSVMHVQNCCFRYKSLLLFCPSRRRRRRRIISSLKDGDVVWRQFVCFLFLNKLDFQLMSTWQFDCISLCVYVIFLCQLSCLVPVTDFLIGDRCLTYNSSNFDRISLPNIKQNGARVTPVVIQWVDLFAVKTVWSSCHQSLFFSLIWAIWIVFNKVQFWRSISPFTWSHKGGIVQRYIPLSTRKIWNELKASVYFECVETPYRAYIEFRRSMTFVFVLDLRITTSKYLL